MLLEVARPALAEELHAVGDAVQRLLDILADAEGFAVDGVAFDASAWPYQRPAWLRDAAHTIAGLERDDRRALAEAYRHDVGFPDAYEDDTFVFRFALLSPAAHAAGDALLRDLYRKVFARANGFVSDGATRAQRGAFERAFRDANPGLHVCPACTLLSLSKPVGRQSLVELDHVLPSARYPHLTVHADNLVPVCKPCNRLKHDRDPLDGGGSALPLSACYLPYLRTALSELSIEFHITRPRVRKLRIVGTAPAAERRIEALDRLLSLSRRWSDELDTVHTSLMTALQIRFGADTPAAAVRTELLLRAEEARALITAVPGKLLEAAWARWLASEGLPTVLEELGRGEGERR